jgi:hypothetical protein
MSYHFTFLSPKFNLAFLACDTPVTMYEGQKQRFTDGITKLQQVKDFVWLVGTG